jgi:hypothetical protein
LGCLTTHGWHLPTPLLLVAGIGVLWPLATIVRRPTSPGRLLGEAFVTTLAMIAAVWASWVLLWLLEHRW